MAFIFKNYMIHRGEIVEKRVRRSGYKLVKLAEKLNVSRNILYNKFKDANLNYHFIIEVGKVLHYDFSRDFPEIRPGMGLQGEKADSVLKVENKYLHLLEKYTHLFEKLVKIANEYELHSVS
jgi:hypothetical protein